MNITLLAPDGAAAVAPTATATPAAAPSPPPSVTDSPFASLDAKLKLPEPAPPVAKPGSKPGAPEPKPGAAAAPSPAPRPEPKELRAELERTKSVLQTKEAELQRLIKEHEAKGKDTSALTDRLQRLEQELNETRGELRRVRFEASDEYRKNYETPFNDAAENARRVLGQINVYDDAGTALRKLNWEADFGRLYRQYESDPAGVIEQAEQMFGKAGQVVLHHIQQLHELQSKASAALDRERAQHQQREKEELAQEATRRETVEKAWKTLGAELAEAVEDYHDDPTDKELVDSRNEGLAIFDAKVRTPQEQMIKNAHIRQRAAAFGPMKLKILRLEKQVADLNKELEGYRPKPPGDKLRRPGGQADTPAPEDWEAGLRKAVD